MDAIVDKVVSVLSDPTVVMVAGVVVEFALRLIPSEKPLSILHLVGAGIKKVGAGLLAVGGFLDKVLPQKVKAPVE